LELLVELTCDSIVSDFLLQVFCAEFGEDGLDCLFVNSFWERAETQFLVNLFEIVCFEVLDLYLYLIALI